LLSVAVAEDLVCRTKESIVKKCGNNIWDGISEDTRQRVAHEGLGRLREDARIFTDKGFEIFRYFPKFPDNKREPCGVLVDFRNLHTLFEPDARLRYTRAGPSPSYLAYPQAGLVTAGYLQAKSLVSDFYPLLEAINTSILSARGEDIEEELFKEVPRWPVYGVSCQIYNAVMHHTRGIGSQHHEVARGKVSGALGGQCIPKTASSAKAKGLLTSCRSKLPHDAYRIKTSNVEICKDLRLENVYWVDFDQISEENRNGR
jgi:hypothetical protein